MAIATFCLFGFQASKCPYLAAAGSQASAWTLTDRIQRKDFVFPATFGFLESSHVAVASFFVFVFAFCPTAQTSYPLCQGSGRRQADQSNDERPVQAVAAKTATRRSRGRQARRKNAETRFVSTHTQLCLYHAMCLSRSHRVVRATLPLCLRGPLDYMAGFAPSTGACAPNTENRDRNVKQERISTGIMPWCDAAHDKDARPKGA